MISCGRLEEGCRKPVPCLQVALEVGGGGGGWEEVYGNAHNEKNLNDKGEATVSEAIGSIRRLPGRDAPPPLPVYSPSPLLLHLPAAAG